MTAVAKTFSVLDRIKTYQSQMPPTMAKIAAVLIDDPKAPLNLSITELAEYRDDSLLCRRFTTTRESFDGVRLFKGEACMAVAGGWRMLAFDAL